MVDGYPLRKSDPNSAIHQRIDETLENCRAMQPLHPTLGQLYPELFRVRDRSPWLTPALERLDWNLRENPDGRHWAAHLGPMIDLILTEMQSGTEDQLFFLCEWAEFLAAHNCHSVAQKIAIFGWKLHRTAGLSAVAVQQLGKALASFPRSGTDITALFRLGWTLFRAENHRDDGDPCWSAAIRCDLRGMPKNRSAPWLALLDANDHAFHFTNSLPKPVMKLLAGVDPGEFAATFGGWTQHLAEANPPRLSYAGLTLLNWLLRLCAAAPKLNVDESLHRIAAARWPLPSRMDWDDRWQATGWLAAYLIALPTRSGAGAFACVEALAMNPATKDFSEVTQLYQTLLASSVTSAATPATTVTGVDGFVIEPGGRLVHEQLMLDEFLRAAHPDRISGSGTHDGGLDRLAPVRTSLVQKAVGESPEAVNRLIAALAERVRWIAGQMQELEYHTGLFWRVETGRLLTEALRCVSDPPLDLLLASLKSDSLEFFGYSPGERIFELCESYVDNHGWNLELLAAMQAWVKTLHGSIAAQTLRRRAGWFLLFEEVGPIKIADCWSNIVRTDVRKLPLEERRRWRAVLGNASFSNTDKPPAKWLKPARAAFAQLGVEKFRVCFRAWFEHFRAHEPLKLTVPGRDLLRILMWYAIVAEDPGVDEALAWYAKAKWKNKASSDRAATTATAFAYVLPARDPKLARRVFEEMLATGATFGGGKIEQAYRQLCELEAKQPVQAQVSSNRPDPQAAVAKLMEKRTRMMKQILLQIVNADPMGGPLSFSATGGRRPVDARWDGDTLVMKTSRDTYRLEARTSRITRASDGAVVHVEIPWEEPVYKMLRAQIDAHDLHQPGEPNWMSLAICARVLADDESGGRIVRDFSTDDDEPESAP